MNRPAVTNRRCPIPKIVVHLTEHEAALLKEHSDVLRELSRRGACRLAVLAESSHAVSRAVAADNVLGRILAKSLEVVENDPAEDYYREDGGEG